MSSILIVESENDKYFIEALIQNMNIDKVEISNGFICNIDDFECMDGLNTTKLTLALKAVSNKIKKEDINNVGIIIDIDDKTKQERLELVNTSINEAYGIANVLEEVNTLKKITINENQNINIATYFTNVNNAGELETVLKEIKSSNSTYADCLQSWQDCLVAKNVNGLSLKDFNKFWISIYTRYDTCSRLEKKQASTKCNNKAAMSKPIWNFGHNCLEDLKTFLRLF